MARSRRKAPRQEAPQSIDDATALTARYIRLLDDIDRIKLEALADRDRIDALRDQAVKPLEEEAKGIFRQLRPWWASNKDDLTEGKRKSIELAGAQIGERTSTPALALPKGFNLGTFVSWLQTCGLNTLIREKPSVDKPACIRALRSLERTDAGPDASDADQLEFSLQQGLGKRLADKGASVTQKDEFFIDRAPQKDREATQIVDVEDEGALA